jgi:sporulation protein YlmC with PRC-barrel domain
MRKSFLASVAVIGLTAASVAYAQEAATSADPAATGTQTQPMTEPVVPDQNMSADTTDGNTAMPAQEGIPGAGPTMTESDGSAGTAPTVNSADAQRYQSYSGQEKGSFSGTIAGNYSADDLMGRDIVDNDGNNVGEISDLLIGSDGSIQNVLVDVGGFLGIGTRTVALDLNQIQMAQGDADEMVVSMTKEQIENLPPVERNDCGWATGAMGGGTPAVPPAATAP